MSNERIVDAGSCIALAMISLTLAFIANHVDSWSLWFLSGWVGRSAALWDREKKQPV